MRAVAHPTRLSLLAALRREGPLTATRAADLLGESSASMSFHLRQLAKYGFVEPAEGGRGRERPWRATSRGISWRNAPADPELAEATETLTALVVRRYFDRVGDWLDRVGDEPPEWQEGAFLGDGVLYLTADELAELNRELHELVRRHEHRLADPAERPDGARPVSLIAFALPLP